MRFLLAAVLVTGCTTDLVDDLPADPADMDPIAGDGQLPPQGRAALVPWLAQGHYLGWACEGEPHPARPPGAHGSNRICSNAALSASTSGTFPIGAASVKELYRDSELIGYAVGRKVSAGTDANSWYWYEAFGASTVADSIGAGLCAGCHDGAPRDNVFTQVP